MEVSKAKSCSRFQFQLFFHFSDNYFAITLRPPCPHIVTTLSPPMQIDLGFKEHFIDDIFIQIYHSQEGNNHLRK